MNPNLKFSKLNDMNKTNGSPTSIVISNSTLCNYEKRGYRYVIIINLFFSKMFTKLDILEYNFFQSTLHGGGNVWVDI